MVVEGVYQLNGTWPERILHLSHEMSEVMTNPAGDGWYNDTSDSNSGLEICDVCSKAATNRSTGVSVTSQILGMTVWQAWSQLACRCVTRRDVTLGDVTGGGLPEPIMTIGNPNDNSYSWHTYFGDVTNWHWGSWGRNEPFLLDMDGNGITAYQLYDASRAWMNAMNIQAGWTGNGSSLGEGNGYDVPVPGDYDGDGIGDWAVWNMQSGNWYICKVATMDS